MPYGGEGYYLFFDVFRRPSVQFALKTSTWTLRNQAVERVVRYGYLCLWNAGDAPQSTSLSFRPADYLVKIPTGMEAIRLKDGKPAPLVQQNGQVTLSSLSVAPRSWEIDELRGACEAVIGGRGSKPQRPQPKRCDNRLLPVLWRLPRTVTAHWWFSVPFPQVACRYSVSSSMVVMSTTRLERVGER